ncbi:MAG: hypothetical protein KGJ89_03390 [Patescibacteria group bacterium]|nr:hypothetical protein [Patescibacteria group bacterium]MDE2015410.1 hypothetical protein [Patescibacteria group bacterium]MDE2226975.1 hypothetical protein [Patescibacteria group bacterium]
MDNNKFYAQRMIGHIIFAVAIFFIFVSFMMYAWFYMTYSHLINTNVQQSILFSHIVDAQLKIGRK